VAGGIGLGLPQIMEFAPGHTTISFGLLLQLSDARLLGEKLAVFPARQLARVATLLDAAELLRLGAVDDGGIMGRGQSSGGHKGGGCENKGFHDNPPMVCGQSRILSSASIAHARNYRPESLNRL
jgi:hypothetical protein